MLHAYLVNSDSSTLVDNVKCILATAIEESRSPQQLMLRSGALLQETSSLTHFKEFVYQMAEKDKVWSLWADFVFVNCYCYIMLYLGVRSSNWNLRLAGLKRMAPLFAAFDRDTSRHLADLKSFPTHVLRCLEKGGFTVNVTGRKFYAVAFDEAHEMCINKDMKSAVTHPTHAYLQKTSLFFNCRIKAFKNLMHILFPERFKDPVNHATITDDTPYTHHCEENVQTMCGLIESSRLVSVQQENRGVVNVFSGQVATPEQSVDMMSFRQVGMVAYRQYITTRLLEMPSHINAPLRHQKLLTMSTGRARKKRMTPKEQEAKQVIKCLRRRLQWCNENCMSFDSGEEQYSILPRALADEDGYPHKSNKSHWTEKLQHRYQSAQPGVIVSSLPWLPEAVIIDAMFMIHTKPLRRTTTMADYIKFLYHQYVLEHFKMGISEVHLVFDNPAMNTFNPKQFEHARRHNSEALKRQHQHHSFNIDSQIPQGWPEFLECATCKRAIVESVGLYLLQIGHHLLQDQQHLIIGGCFSDEFAWLITSGVLPEKMPSYATNALEADNRIWRHAIQTSATKILICSPDTDVYNIGLSAPGDKDYVVQLNIHHAIDKKYLILKHLQLAFQRDPDLHSLSRDHLSLIMQSLYISTGCDYISYFKTFGKATIITISCNMPLLFATVTL